MYQKYTGIILKKHPLGEADELLTIYTRDEGKIRVRAGGVRKPLSKLAGHLQSLNEVEFETAGGSFTRRRGYGGLPVLISVRALAINSYLRQNLRKFGYALVGIETLYRMCGDGQENADAYDELRNFLRDLGESIDENLTVRRFQLHLLAVSGYAFPRENITPSSSPPHEGEKREGVLRGGGITQLTPAFEREIDQFIDYVLEREIKSAKVLDSLI